MEGPWFSALVFLDRSGGVGNGGVRYEQLLGVAGGELVIPSLVFVFGADIKVAATVSVSATARTRSTRARQCDPLSIAAGCRWR
jgi:hypothetical protein